MATYTVTGHPLNYADLGLSTTAISDTVEAAMTITEIGDTVTLTLSGPDDAKVKGHGILR